MNEILLVLFTTQIHSSVFEQGFLFKKTLYLTITKQQKLLLDLRRTHSHKNPVWCLRYFPLPALCTNTLVSLSGRPNNETPLWLIRYRAVPVIGSYPLSGRSRYRTGKNLSSKGKKRPDNEFYTKQKFGPITRPRVLETWDSCREPLLFTTTLIPQRFIGDNSYSISYIKARVYGRRDYSSLRPSQWSKTRSNEFRWLLQTLIRLFTLYNIRLDNASETVICLLYLFLHSTKNKL